MVAANSNKEISRKEIFLFALGDIYGGGGQSILSVIYLIFLTNIIRIDPVWAGSIVMISKIWDAVNDPLMGMISDNTRSRIGRRRPFLLIGGILLIPAIALLWFPNNINNDFWKIIYVLITYLFYFTVNTIIMVPYSSMSTEVTTDFNNRNKVNLLRLVFSLASTAICTLIPSLMFEKLEAGSLGIWTFYFIMVFAFGLVFALPHIFIALFSKERAPYEEEKAVFSFKEFVKPLQVKSFRKLIVMYICQALALDITSAVIIFYSLYVVNISSTVFLGIFLGVQLLMSPLLYHYAKKVSKTKIYRFGLPLAILASLGIAFYPQGYPLVGIYALSALTAIGFAGAQMMSWIIFPDVVDIVTLGMGDRKTGICSGVMTFIRTGSAALASFLIGLVLQITGFIKPTDAVPKPLQTPSAILGIRLLIVFAFVVLMTIAYFVARKFRLNPELSMKIKELNDKEFSKEELSVQERDEKKQILEEFV